MGPTSVLILFLECLNILGKVLFIYLFNVYGCFAFIYACALHA